jgi:hypothetical protein
VKARDLTGMQFGRLTAVSSRSVQQGSRKRIFWLCRCNCGSEKEIVASSLVHGVTLSCGCLQREILVEKGITHGECYTPRYKTWAGIIQRCTNPNNHAFRNYGGRGIAVCDKWLTYDGFRDDVPQAPGPGFSLDRIDNDKGYELDNVRWATPKEQRVNQRPRSDWSPR